MFLGHFLGQNIHFALGLLAALVCFAVCGLYFDAWLGQKERKDFAKWLGFSMLAIGFFAYGLTVEQPLTNRTLANTIIELIALLFRLGGYLAIVWGLWLDPIQTVPEMKGLELEPDQPAAESPPAKKSPGWLLGGGANLAGLQILLPITTLIVTILYWRRAKVGLERHLRPVVVAFGSIFVFELIDSLTFLQASSNITLSTFFQAFGWLWWLEQALLSLSMLFLGRWVWTYMIRRLQTQLFMIFTAITVLIFLLSTVSFSYLLMRNISGDSLNNLQTAVNVLTYALDSKRAATKAAAEGLASQAAVAAAVEAKDHPKLVELTSQFLTERQLSSLIVTGEGGLVLLRAEDPDRWGDSLSEDPLLKRTAIGEAGSSLHTTEATLAPVVQIQSAVPLRNADQAIIGSVMVGLTIDNAFMDGIKKNTGLEAAIYSDNVRSATSFVAADGKSRLVGIKEENPLIKQQVLQKGESYSGILTSLNTSLLAVYTPLRDVDNTVVGMLFIGKPYATLINTANSSIELTFVVAGLLLLASIYPTFKISRFLTDQLS